MVGNEMVSVYQALVTVRQYEAFFQLIHGLIFMRPEIFEFLQEYRFPRTTFFRKVKDTIINSESFLEVYDANFG